MLHVKERFMIKDLCDRGWSVSDIARESGHDRKTVRNVLAELLLPTVKPRQARACRLYLFVDYLQKWLGEGVWNAHKLYTGVKARGYADSETRVRARVQSLRAARLAQTTVRFETEPGQQAQVDWRQR